MSFWGLITSLSYKQLGQLFVWFFKHPFFTFATAKATYFTIKVVQKEFPNQHHKNNKANAFRHALWNLFIAKECSKFIANKSVVLDWAKKITDWHEDFSVNEKMQRLMDLHNNFYGREKFSVWQDLSRETMSGNLKKQLSKAVQVSEENQLKKIKDRLIYLE